MKSLVSMNRSINMWYQKSQDYFKREDNIVSLQGIKHLLEVREKFLGSWDFEHLREWLLNHTLVSAKIPSHSKTSHILWFCNLVYKISLQKKSQLSFRKYHNPVLPSFGWTIIYFYSFLLDGLIQEGQIHKYFPSIISSYILQAWNSVHWQSLALTWLQLVYLGLRLMSKVR